jgi:PAS domain S-box-containing protein
MTISATLKKQVAVRTHRESRQTFVDGQSVELTSRGFDILHRLLERRGAVVSFDEFARDVWGYEPTEDHHFIQAAVWRLRRTLEAAGAPDLIESVSGVGYVIRADTPDLTEVSGRSGDAPVVIVNREGQIRFANQAASILTGYPIARLRDMNTTELWETGAPEIHRALRDGAIEHSQASASGIARLGNGGVAPVDVSLTPLDLGTDEALFLITAKPTAHEPRPNALHN